MVNILKLSAALFRAADKLSNALIREKGYDCLNERERGMVDALEAMRKEVT